MNPNPSAQHKTSVVLVMAAQDPVLEEVRGLLERLDVVLYSVASLQEFQRVMRQGLRPEVVIAGVSLSDGNWCDVLTATVRTESTAQVLICSREVDERFWSEAIWRGVHDILVAPFTTDYLERIVDPRFRHEPRGPAAGHDPADEPESEQRSDTGGCPPLEIPLPEIA